ncbi:hypothetical protein MPSEU_000853600 [Mayamaea pseudoterrestris]|nr:hypothetical protein MPSEU_000853600 [Mayamaea pseudoterrestris]
MTSCTICVSFNHSNHERKKRRRGPCCRGLYLLPLVTATIPRADTLYCQAFTFPLTEFAQSTRWKSSKRRRSFPFAPNTLPSPAAAPTLLQMSLVPLQASDLQQLLATKAPTAEQYASYTGRSPREKYDRLLESAIVTLLGTTMSYFMSFVLGSFVATLFGTLFLFWGVLSPQLKAYQRNWEFLGGRTLIDYPEMDEYAATSDGLFSNRGLYGCLFLGRLVKVCVVNGARSRKEYTLDDFQDYRMDDDEQEQLTGDPYLLRVTCVDAYDKTLQVHARLSPEYLDLQPNMMVTAVLLSTDPTFETLAALTDLYVLDQDVWIGDYPYLDRAELQALLQEDDEVYQALCLEEDAAVAATAADLEQVASFEEPLLPRRDEGNDDDESGNNELVLAQRRRRRRYQ